PLLGLGMFLVLGLEEDVLTQRFSFIVPFFSEHILLMMAMSGIFAALRIIGAVGLRRNRMWGYALSVINCCVTLVLITFIRSARIALGTWSGAHMVMTLMGRNRDVGDPMSPEPRCPEATGEVTGGHGAGGACPVGAGAQALATARLVLEV